MRTGRVNEVRHVVKPRKQRKPASIRPNGRDLLDEIEAMALWTELLWRRYWLGFLCGLGSSMIIVGLVWREVILTISDVCK